jgi:hypothetical protein
MQRHQTSSSSEPQAGADRGAESKCPDYMFVAHQLLSFRDYMFKSRGVHSCLAIVTDPTVSAWCIFMDDDTTTQHCDGITSCSGAFDFRCDDLVQFQSMLANRSLPPILAYIEGVADGLGNIIRPFKDCTDYEMFVTRWVDTLQKPRTVPQLQGTLPPLPTSGQLHKYLVYWLKVSTLRMRQRVCQLCARLNWEQEHVQVQASGSTWKKRKWFLTINTIPVHDLNIQETDVRFAVQDRIAVTIASNESFGHILSMERKLGVIVTNEVVREHSRNHERKKQATLLYHNDNDNDNDDDDDYDYDYDYGYDYAA